MDLGVGQVHIQRTHVNIRRILPYMDFYYGFLVDTFNMIEAI